MAGVKFRFDSLNHEYIDLESGVVLPHVTGLLEQAGLVDDTWFTEESSERGTCVHKMTADYDLGAMDPATCISAHRAYLLAHVAAMKIIRPEILEVEVPHVHSRYRFGARLDRLVKIHGLIGTLEIKTTDAPAESHRVQTALQTFIVEDQTGVPAESCGRWALYLKPDGKFKFIDHNANKFEKVSAYTKARKALRDFCGTWAEIPAAALECPF